MNSKKKRSLSLQVELRQNKYLNNIASAGPQIYKKVSQTWYEVRLVQHARANDKGLWNHEHAEKGTSEKSWKRSRQRTSLFIKSLAWLHNQDSCYAGFLFSQSSCNTTMVSILQIWLYPVIRFCVRSKLFSKILIPLETTVIRARYYRVSDAGITGNFVRER